MISESLINELLKVGLQPFPYRTSDKKGYFNKAYFLNKEKTNETATNFNGYFDIEKYFHLEQDDCAIGLALKVGGIRELNKGYLILDFDLKGDDEFEVFDDILERLNALGLMTQFEEKNNGNGIHVVYRMSEEEMAKLALQGKIHRGNHSFVEVLTAGKFVRLCPNKDYHINDGSEHLDLTNVPFIKLDTLLELSANNPNDKVLKKTTYKFVNEITKLDIDFDIVPSNKLPTEDENLIYSFVKSQKMDYELASKLASGLGHMKLKDLYLKVIPESVRHIYEGLFLGGFHHESRTTVFMNTLLEGLRNNKDKIKIQGKYMDKADIKNIYSMDNKKILLVSPTGTGKTFTALEVAKENGLKVIFTMPNKATVEQQSKKYGIPGVYDNKSIEKALETSDIIICTLNKLTKIPGDYNLSDHILINDEAHTTTTTCDYRAEIIYKAAKLETKFKKVIDITATPEPLFMRDYDRKITFVKKDSKKYKATVYEVQNKKQANIKLLEVLDDSKCKVLCLNNDIQFNNLYANTRENCISWNSKTKNDKDYKELVKTNLIPKHIEKVLATDIFSAGLNIENKEEWKIVIKSVCDPSTIKQLVARFRELGFVNIILIKSATIRTDSTYDKEKKIKNIRFVTKELCEKMNDGIIAGVGTSFLQDRFYTYEESVFEVFNPAINRSCWKTFYSLSEVDDLFSLFDKGSIEIKVHSFAVLDETNLFLDELEEVKALKKELKEIKKNKTLELIATKQINCLYYVEDEKYDTGLLKKYLEFRNKWSLEHEIGYIFTEDSKKMDKIMYKVLARNVDKSFKENEKYKIARHIYKKLETGDEINVKEYCAEKKFNQTSFKIALNSIWETEEIRDKKKKYFVLLSRNIKTDLSKKQEFELLKSGVIFR
ncbi:MAG: DEAD/DEAH box helicase family protein [Fusobacteriaceae bacterium]